MATGDELAHSIEPGSVPYGERQNLEAGMAAVAQSPPGPTGGPVAPPGAAPQGDDSITPESVLGGGSVSELPVTSGLEGGPGPGPMLGIEATTEQQKLQEIALSAPSAALRHMARVALRNIYIKQQRGR